MPLSLLPPGPLRRARPRGARRQGHRRAGPPLRPRACGRRHRGVGVDAHGGGQGVCRHAARLRSAGRARARLRGGPAGHRREALGDVEGRASPRRGKGGMAPAPSRRSRPAIRPWPRSCAASTCSRRDSGPRRRRSCRLPPAIAASSSRRRSTSGATFAALGRDRDAAGVWQIALGTETRPAVVYAMVADARLRDGQAQAAVDILKPAYEKDPPTRSCRAAWRWPTCWSRTTPRRFRSSTPRCRGGPPTRRRSSPAVVAHYELVRGAAAVHRRRGQAAEVRRRLQGPRPRAAREVSPDDASAVTAGSYWHGCNYPWSFDGTTAFYGLDFGANVWGSHLGVSTRRDAVARDFAEMARLGFTVTRWFLFCDGRSGIVYDDRGLPEGLDRAPLRRPGHRAGDCASPPASGWRSSCWITGGCTKG